MSTTKYIGKVQVGSGGNQILIGSTMYGICTTDAAYAAKEITTTQDSSGKFINGNFDTPLHGITIHIKFVNGNTATSGVTLQVGSDSARNVIGNCTCPANTIISFTLDENQEWVVNDNVDTNTTYTFAEGSENGKFSVAPLGGSAQSVKIHGLGAAAYKGVVTDLGGNPNSTGLPTAEAVSTYITSMTGGLAGLSGAMHFRGIATSQPEGTTIPTGIADYTNANPESGDVVVYGSQEYVWINSTEGWALLGDEGSYAFDNAVIHNSLLTTKGDIIYRNDDGPTRLAAGTNGNFLKLANGVPAWGTVGASDVGLDNLTNYAQIEKRIGEAKGDMIYFSASASPVRLAIGAENTVLTSVSGVPTWQAISITDEKVKQSPYNNSTNDYTFNILFKHTNNDTEETNGVYYSTVTNKKLTYNPKSGVLSAFEFHGKLQSSDILTALTNSNVTTPRFLHATGAWKDLSVGVTEDNTNGLVLTDVTLTAGQAPSVTWGTLANASIDSGVLILVNQSASTFSAGTFPSIDSKTKARLSVTYT